MLLQPALERYFFSLLSHFTHASSKIVAINRTINLQSQGVFKTINCPTVSARAPIHHSTEVGWFEFIRYRKQNDENFCVFLLSSLITPTAPPSVKFDEKSSNHPWHSLAKRQTFHQPTQARQWPRTIRSLWDEGGPLVGFYLALGGGWVYSP